MSDTVKNKWITTKMKPDGSLTNSKFEDFKKFKHTSPFMLQLFDFITHIYKKELKSGLDLEIIQKYCLQLEVFAFNTINLILIDRVRGVHVLMDCVHAYVGDLDESET